MYEERTVGSPARNVQSIFVCEWCHKQNDMVLSDLIMSMNA